MTEAHRLLVAVVGGDDHRPLLTLIEGLPSIDGGHDRGDVLAGVDNGGGILRRSAAVGVSGLVNGYLVGEDERRVGRLRCLDPRDGRGCHVIVGVFPTRVEGHEDVVVGRNGVGAGGRDVVDVFPVGDHGCIDARVVCLEQVEHRRPGVIGRGVEDVVDHATLVVPDPGEDRCPRRTRDRGVPDDAGGAGDTLFHEIDESDVGHRVGQHFVQVRAVDADQQHAGRRCDLNGGDRVGAAAGRCRGCTADRHGTGGRDRQCRERRQWQKRNRRRGGKRRDGGESHGRGDDGRGDGHLLG